MQFGKGSQSGLRRKNVGDWNISKTYTTIIKTCRKVLKPSIHYVVNNKTQKSFVSPWSRRNVITGTGFAKNMAFFLLSGLCKVRVVLW